MVNLSRMCTIPNNLYRRYSLSTLKSSKPTPARWHLTLPESLWPAAPDVAAVQLVPDVAAVRDRGVEEEVAGAVGRRREGAVRGNLEIHSFF